MEKDKQKKESRKVVASDRSPEKDEGLIVAAAKAIGGAAGTVAHSMGIHGDTAEAAAHRQRAQGKLQSKNKARLPRRLKKATRKQRVAQPAA